MSDYYSIQSRSECDRRAEACVTHSSLLRTIRTMAQTAESDRASCAPAFTAVLLSMPFHGAVYCCWICVYCCFTTAVVLSTVHRYSHFTVRIRATHSTDVPNLSHVSHNRSSTMQLYTLPHTTTHSNMQFHDTQRRDALSTSPTRVTVCNTLHSMSHMKFKFVLFGVRTVRYTLHTLLSCTVLRYHVSRFLPIHQW